MINVSLIVDEIRINIWEIQLEYILYLEYLIVLEASRDAISAVPSKLSVVFFNEYRPLFRYESKCTKVFKVSINVGNWMHLFIWLLHQALRNHAGRWNALLRLKHEYLRESWRDQRKWKRIQMKPESKRIERERKRDEKRWRERETHTLKDIGKRRCKERGRERERGGKETLQAQWMCNFLRKRCSAVIHHCYQEYWDIYREGPSGWK